MSIANDYVRVFQLDLMVRENPELPHTVGCPACRHDVGEYARMDLWPADNGVACIGRCEENPAHDLSGMLCQDGRGRLRFRVMVFDGLVQTGR